MSADPLVVQVFQKNLSAKLRMVARLIWLLAGVSSGLHGQSFSSLVYPGEDGRLVYEGYANEGQSSADNLMIDFSHAGYMGGGVPIPWVPVEIVLEPQPGDRDDYARIQAAIDALSTRPLSPAGFRGTLLLRAGSYRVSQTLRITADGVVIRGEGQHEAGTVVRYTATHQSALFDFRSTNGFWTRIANTETPIIDEVVPSGVRSFRVASPSGLSVGDRIIVHRTPNQAWIEELGMDKLRDLAVEANHPDPDSIVNWTPEVYRSTIPRRITAIDGNRITVDAPLVHAIEAQYGGGEVYRYNFDNALRNVGIERIRLESDFASEEDEAHGWSAVVFTQVENAWARQVTARYFGYSAVKIGFRCQYITVEDCAQLDPVSIRTGGRRYSFVVNRSSFILMQRLYARQGRHDFVTQERTPGPVVFVDSLAEVAYDDIGPHHRYSEGVLFDNIKASGPWNGGSMNVQNRNWSGTGHGWSGAQTVFWNCDTTKHMICDAPTGAMNFSIGNLFSEQRQGRWPPEEPDGIWESRGVPVTPRSLYYAQLADRLGYDAVANVTTSAQREGTIWNDLSAWKGDSQAPGLPEFGPLGIHIGYDVEGEIQNMKLNAALHYPLPSNFPVVIHGWTQVSGPVQAIFEDVRNPSTSVTLPAPGVYVFQFAVSQDDDHDPLNIVTYHGTGTIQVTVTLPSFATVDKSSVDMIVGRSGERAANQPGYYANSTNDRTGGIGATFNQSREDLNVVFGYALPNLPAARMLNDAVIHFEVASRLGFHQLEIFLLDTPAPQNSGTDFFYHGVNDPNTRAVRIGGVLTNGPHSLALGDEAVALLKRFYREDGTPTQAKAFFRFNLNVEFPQTNYYQLNIQPTASSLELFALPADTFAGWISLFNLDPAHRGPADDPDGDGIPNAMENFFGTHPGVASRGITLLTATSSSLTFTHPQNPQPASNLSAAYQWSTGFVDFNAHGETNANGTRVSFSASSVDGIATVHANISGTPANCLFVRITVAVD